ncbi:MAG: hypothetical protein CVV00_13575 [Firmicutes bacterium HGW-Firmicutes-5]|nr:MAG: hypothetical protein CVV00_13575 [Firmicutes bacterium HGW-Firmicutes-5]
MEFPIILITLFFIVPAAVSIWKKIPINEAAKLAIQKTSEFWKWLNNTPTPIKYNVFIGNDYHSLMKQYSTLEKWFETYRYASMNITDNLVIYNFNVSSIKKEIDPLDLVLILEKISERVLTEHAVACGINLPIEDLCGVHLRGDRLSFGFAKNDSGIKELNTTKNNMRKFYGKKAVLKSDDTIEINWDDDENDKADDETANEDEKIVKQNEETVNEDEEI